MSKDASNIPQFDKFFQQDGDGIEIVEETEDDNDKTK